MVGRDKGPIQERIPWMGRAREERKPRGREGELGTGQQEPKTVQPRMDGGWTPTSGVLPIHLMGVLCSK